MKLLTVVGVALSSSRRRLAVPSLPQVVRFRRRSCTPDSITTRRCQISFCGVGHSVPAHLGIGGGSHGANTGRMLEAIEQVLLEQQPDALLVYGDTDSTLAGALAARLKIPVVHVEAGLRSFNRHQPEEQNRSNRSLGSALFCSHRLCGFSPSAGRNRK